MLNRLADPLSPARWLWATWKRRGALRAVRQPIRLSNVGHPLSEELVVSITSYPPRFGVLDLTLRSLLLQSVRPDRMILWVAEDDRQLLPPEVTDLRSNLFEIRTCEDLRSYKKLVPALEAFPDAYIVTADDDIYYPPCWLAELISGIETELPTIVCKRAARVVRSANGTLAPFLRWHFRVTDADARKPSKDIMAEGAGGVLYPPHALSEIVGDRELFQRLSATSDDLWFYWCARMAGTHYKKVGGKDRSITWAGSGRSSLWQQNRTGGNDRAIQALEREFGLLP